MECDIRRQIATYRPARFRLEVAGAGRGHGMRGVKSFGCRNQEESPDSDDQHDMFFF